MIGGQSRTRLYWDVLIAALAFFSAVYVVWQLAFAAAGSVQIWSPIYLIDLVFLADIAANFFTSYRDKGAEVTDSGKIARRYARTMMPVDLIATIPWELLLLSVSGELWLGAPLLLWLRLPRVLRVIRLFAIFQFFSFRDIADQAQKENFVAYFNFGHFFFDRERLTVAPHSDQLPAFINKR